MKKFTLTFFVTLMTGISTLFAQDLRVTGTVSDESGSPIPGVTVLVQGTSRATITSTNGSYSITAPVNGTLEFTYVGMLPQSISVNNRAIVDVVMIQDAHQIEDVIVTGYGTFSRSAYTGAASVIGEDVISKKIDANFVKSLEGTVAGFQMNTSSSAPGTWGSVYIRGRGSLNSGTQPLYVVDGIPVSSDTEGMYADENNYFDPMASINPMDIENVTVLKDAAATAIYGSRAANGVILVTTKKGSEGKFNINLDIKQGFVSMGNNNMDYADAFQTIDLYANGSAKAFGSTYEEEYDYYTDYYGWDGKSTYDWIDAVTRKGYYQDYNLNVSGRNGATGYYASLGYLDTKGLVIGSDLERFSGRLNVESKFKFFTFGATASYSTATKNGASESLSGSMNSPMTGAVSSMTPLDPFYDENGDYANVLYYNPLAIWDKEKGDIYKNTTQTINLSPYLQVDFGLGIYAKTTLGVNIVDYREYQYWSAIYNEQAMESNGEAWQYNAKNTIITWNNIVGWKYNFNGKHDVNLMLGQEMQRKNYYNESYTGSDFPLADLGNRKLSTAGTWGDSTYNEQEARLASYFVDAHYTYDNRYYLSASFRRDGSSVFGSDTRWGNFWSLGGKWRFSNENFLKNNRVLTNADLRISYGTVGNQDISWYAARGLYTTGYNYNSRPGMIPTSFENEKLSWEASKKFDIGLDLSFINRINLTVDFFNEVTDDTLFKVPISRTTGQAEIYQNIGSIRNRGIEFSLNATIMNKGDLHWTAYATMTYNKNEVVKLAGDPIVGSLTTIEKGYPYRQWYMKEYAGVDYETGRPMWYRNVDGDETTLDYNQAEQRYVGSADPKVSGGFGTSFAWKGLDFNLAFTYRLGGKVYDYAASFTGFGMSLFSPLEDVALNSWTDQNKGAKYPEWIYGDPYYATSDSSRFLYSSNFLRISNISLGYTFPAAWTKKAFIEKLRLYVSVDNLYTFTASDFVGYNPETYTSGYIAWQYPATRTFIGGIQITF